MERGRKPSYNGSPPRRYAAGQLPAPDAPLHELVRKLVAMRARMALRALRTSPAARRRAVLAVCSAALLLAMASAFSRLPEVNTGRDPLVPRAVGRAAGSLLNETDVDRLRRRTAERNLELSRQARGSKRERLQQAAATLNTQLEALKERAQVLGPNSRRQAGGGGGGGGAANSAAADDAAASASSAAAEPCGGVRHREFRIAMVLPWMDRDGAKAPAWFSHLVASASASASLVDWYVPHEGSLSLPRGVRAPNVKLVELRRGGLARLFAARLGGALGLGGGEARTLEKRLRALFEAWPRLVAEYKPTFGEVFSAWLQNYTHWGYTDLDVIYGALPRFVQRSELTDFDLFSYSFGDAEAVYLRGQWTVHRNGPTVNGLWRGCAHLAAGLLDELGKKEAHLRRMEAAGSASTGHKRFISAEGCYSHVAAHTAGLRIKVATKQFVGMGRESGQIYALRGTVWRCERQLQAAELASLAAASAPECSTRLAGVHTPRGEPERLRVSGSGCGGWMPAEHRMCAPQLKGDPSRDLILENGAFAAQRSEASPTTVALGGLCREGAFFHMQEWKKRWASDGAASVDAHARPHEGIRIAETGIHALPQWTALRPSDAAREEPARGETKRKRGGKQ